MIAGTERTFSSPISTGKTQWQGNSRVPNIPFTSRPGPGGFASAPELSLPFEKSDHERQPSTDRGRSKAIELLFSASVPRNCSVASTEKVEVGDQKGGGCGTRNTSTGESVEVHVVMALDNNYLRGALATMNSVQRNALCPGRVLFHFPVTVDEAGQRKLKGVIHKHLPTLRFHMYPFKVCQTWASCQ
ncbi:hypothetical protein CYMTET_25862 [Cymbomonas tetramitiformis]|uniref:Hexosyltransferase n=1 Tax=Cymbomonas tetramitiformis TaxID=36881 RepID=A0AAE0FTN9_9CHLO|nr:hypothetical protein CYMTET_25862 [Cymbomonas tetramitiformis]